MNESCCHYSNSSSTGFSQETAVSSGVLEPTWSETCGIRFHSTRKRGEAWGQGFPEMPISHHLMSIPRPRTWEVIQVQSPPTNDKEAKELLVTQANAETPIRLQ